MKAINYLLILFLLMGFTACEKDKDAQEAISNNAQEIIFNMDGDYLRIGKDKNGAVLYTIDGDYIRAGEGTTGDIVYTIHGNFIRAGEGITGPVVYSFDGKYVRVGNHSLFELEGDDLLIGWNKNENNDQRQVYSMNFAGPDVTTNGSISAGRSGPVIYRLRFDYREDRYGKELLGGSLYKVEGKPVFTIRFNNTTLHPSSAKIYAGNGSSETSTTPVYNMTLSYYNSGELKEGKIFVGKEASSKNYLYTVIFHSTNSGLSSAQVYSYR